MLATPILPGRAEAWRRMCQELLDSRAEEFATSSRRLNVLSQQVWVVPVARREIVIMRLDVANPNAALAALVSPATPFDTWLLRQLDDLLGVDLTTLAARPGELVLQWTDKEER
jgi:hypothetical protein